MSNATQIPGSNLTILDVKRDLVRQSYWEYVRLVHRGRWIAAPYLKYLCNMVQSFLDDELVNDDGTVVQILCVSMPPQHGKSMSITETLPSWYLGTHPTHRVIEVSYNEDFARKFGRRNKEKINEFGRELFDIGISKQTGAMDEWELDNNIGGMLSRGVGGSITGNPCNLMIIDDPVKNRKEAESETYRNSVWDEWLNSMRTRLAAGAKTLVIMTRWHEDDMVGRMLDQEGSRAQYLNLPCEAEENDPIYRDLGEPLGPILGKDAAWLADFKPVYMTKKGKKVWESLFQGHPTSADGDIFKRMWFKYYDYETLPGFWDEQIQSWDCAFKGTDGSDFVCGTVWGRRGGRYYLLDRLMERLDFPGTINAIMQMTKKWPAALTKLVEDKANGPAVISVLQKDVPGLIAVNPDGGKQVRAYAVSPAFESGNVYFPDTMIAPWVVGAVDEMCGFPNVAHDDFTDSTTQALNRFIYYTGLKEEPQDPPANHEEALARRIDENLGKLVKKSKRSAMQQI